MLIQVTILFFMQTIHGASHVSVWNSLSEDKAWDLFFPNTSVTMFMCWWSQAHTQKTDYDSAPTIMLSCLTLSFIN